MVSDDTIAAIATTPGESGLCVIRMSGPDVFSVADRVFRGTARPSRSPSHTVLYGRLVDPDTHDVIDEVLVTVMRAPRSFTREHVAEISGHGGTRPAQRILETLLHAGARLAEPGEFTKRAFLNGRLDLLQAEAVAEIIRARTDASLRVALRQLDGRLSQPINMFRDRIIDLLALVEVGLDFTEEDIPAISNTHLLALTLEIQGDLARFIEKTQRWRVLHDGARVAIIGRPNVGKSSLLNALMGWDRAIVDATPGTTRDTISETLEIEGIPITFVDTAGLRTPIDTVEARGIERTEREIATADCFLWVLDGAEPLQTEDLDIVPRISSQPVIPIINKIDLPARIEHNRLSSCMTHPCVRISIKTGEGLVDLRTAIIQQFGAASLLAESEGIVNARHYSKLAETLRSLEYACTLLQSPCSLELAAIELRMATRHLGEIIGKELGDDILNRVFAAFCIGK